MIKPETQPESSSSWNSIFSQLTWEKHIGTYPKVMVSILELKADDTTKADLHDRQLVMSK